MMTMSEYKQLSGKRSGFYSLLSRFFLREADSEFLSQLRAVSLPENCGDDALQQGCEVLRQSLETLNSDSPDLLAADFAKVFLAAGEYQGKAAFPYESVYTSRDRLVRQDAWEEVRRVYDAAGVALGEVASEIMEDHASAELNYMALLCSRDAGGEKAALRSQQSFLENHLLNWMPNFCADVEKYSETDFYRAVALLTEAYLRLDAELIKELLSEENDGGGAYSLTYADMDSVLKKLSGEYRIYAPKLTERRNSRGERIVRYREINSVSEIVRDRQSDFSPKEIYYPVVQTMFYFTESTSAASELNDQREIIIFARPCDINAMRRLDTVFLKNGEKDLYYARLREKVKMVMLECGDGFENCACVSFNSNVCEDYALALRMTDDGIFVQVKDSAFEKLFSSFEAADYTPRFVTENKRNVTLPQIPDSDALRKAAKLAFWDGFNDKCIGCGGCNTVCPTCSCFDTVDITYDDSGKEGERRRVWSSCMLNTFTETAGGSRARSTAGENMRFKVLHKVYDYEKRFGTDESMCVGCGRCIDRCPKDIDFYDTVNALSSELGKED